MSLTGGQLFNLFSAIFEKKGEEIIGFLERHVTLVPDIGPFRALPKIRTGYPESVQSISITKFFTALN